jgi:hypothetical protein
MYSANSSWRGTKCLLGAAAAVAVLGSSPLIAQQASGDSRMPLRFDYTGAEALVQALSRDSLSDSDVDRLLAVPGVLAMVDNVTRFHPGVGRPEFRKVIKAYVLTRRELTRNGQRLFQFDAVVNAAPMIREIISQIKASEPEMVRRVAGRLTQYAPPTDKLALTVYFVAGGVSDGFVPDSAFSPAFYSNLARAEGDVAGAELVMTHEMFHVVQKAVAQHTPSLQAAVNHPEQLPPLEHLFAATLWEGSAMYVADPKRFAGQGSYGAMWRDRAIRNTTPARIRENFALFDSVAAELRAGRMRWSDVDRIGFSGDENDERFYAVGYLMAAAIDQYCGSRCIARLMERPPVEFFREYVSLYKKDSTIAGRFSQDTEKLLGPAPKLNHQ